MVSLYYTENVIRFFWREESTLDEIIMDGSDDDLGLDDEIEMNGDDSKVAKMEIMIKYEYSLSESSAARDRFTGRVD